MRERQNKPGKSGQYSKPGRVNKSEKPAFKKESRPSRPASGFKKEGSGTPYKKRGSDQDPNELAPPRFLKKREGGDAPYGRERKPGGTGFRGRNDDASPSRKRSYGDKPSGEKRPYGDRPSGEKRPFRDKPYGEKKPYGDKPYGEKKSYGDKPYSDRKSYGDKPFGEKKSYGDKPYSDRKPYGDKPYGEKKSYGDKPYSERKSYGDKPYGEKKSYGDKPFRERSGEGFKPRTGKPESGGTDRPYKGRGGDDFKGRSVRTGSGDERQDEKKPFRPKYDPQVPTKKSYSTRKKELLDIKEDPDDIRLNKFIANAGICSRREADEIIKQGLVTVNGDVIVEMGYKVKKGDTVKYDGRKILPEPFVYILMNKPKDFITTTDDEKGRKTVMDLLAGKVGQRVYPIGRLDRNTTGVLLLTNDGDVAQAMTHPSFNIKKVYHVVLDKKVSGGDLDKLVEGVELEDGNVHADAAAFVDNEDRRHVGVEIHSGKNRVVRRMFEFLGYEVEKLDRVSMGIFTKKDLPRGKWRFLSDSEIAHLQKIKA